MTANSRIGKGTGPRPHVWKSGTDPVRHEQYTQWLRQRAQAHFRKEDWQLEFDDFVAVWGLNWHNRGRASEDMCMTRDDYDLPWHTSNVTIVPRHEHVRRSWIVKFARGQTGRKNKRKPVI
jgi:hypothetical protein